MCGLAGFVDTGPRVAPASWPELLERMGNVIRHRGPDGSGIWSDPQIGVGLVHRRLAILDLSPAGHQPMVSACGRYIIAFNGEIYNHLDLRAQLESQGSAPEWRGHSDTETLLACIVAWGFQATLQAAIGMFAISLVDRHERVLYLARDRLGEKPLYYGVSEGVLLFGSQLGAIKAHPAFTRDLDRNAIARLLGYGCIGGTASIYRSFRKLPPGTWLAVPLDRATSGLPAPIPYWSVAEVARRGRAAPFRGTPAEAVDELDRLIRQAVTAQQIADVPIGAFLSGGIDSSTIAAVMQSISATPIKTFTIGFHEEGYNEAVHAKAVAQHLGTDHTELYVTPEQALVVIPTLPGIWDEPFADSSQIPTFLVAELARTKVTVALSGDAGDELFGGYRRYVEVARQWEALTRLPSPIRRIGAFAFRAARPLAGIGPITPDWLSNWARKLGTREPMDLYAENMMHWKDPARIVIGADPFGADNEKSDMDLLSRMMLSDSCEYLPDDILTKVDRAAMSVSLETRVPLLDHRVVEFAWQLPSCVAVHDGVQKWPLRAVLERYVPRTLTDRPKMGFGIPLGAWLKGPLRPWAEALLDTTRLNREGFLDAAEVRRKWEEHISGRSDWKYYIWDVLMFQAWLEAQ